MASGALFGQKPLAVVEDAGDHMAHLLQSLQGDWLPAYAYVQGKLGIQIDLWIRSGDLDGHLDHYGLLFQRAPGPDLKRVEVGFLDVAGFKAPELRFLVLGDSHECREKRPMFVFVGEGAESGENVRAWAVRSYVWLAKVEEPEDARMEPVNLPVPSLALAMAALVRRLDIEYWKGVAVRGFEPVGLDQDPDEMVKGRPEILDVVPGNSAPLQWRLLDNVQQPECLRRLHVYFGDESIGLGISIEKGADLGVERVEMGFRPLDLGEATG